MPRARKLCLSLALAAGLATGPASACGYHQPVDVERGILNLVYPDALYVTTAVWQAEQAGHLGGARPAGLAAAQDPFAFHGEARRLERLGERLAQAAPQELSGFSLVLIESMLWTRYTLAYGRALSAVHSDGRGEGDTVVVTHGLVVRALVEGRMDGERALQLGLLRLYGEAEDVARIEMLLTSLRASGS